MLTKSELEKIKSFLENSQNPLFFFDNDADGLCSFIILQRALGRGKGVPVRSFPELNDSYFRKVEELNPDAVFILDKPRVGEDFINAIYEKAIPIIWIDHHNVQVSKEALEKVEYFNSFPSAEPVTYLCQNIFKRKEDLWLAIIGCISDVYMPDFAEQFSKENPELFNPEFDAFESLFRTDIGKIVRILNFGLKDTTTNVLKLIRFLIKAKSPQDVLQESKDTKQLHHKYEQLNKIAFRLVEKAEANKTNSKVLFLSYSGETSMSSEISNELVFKHKDKLVVVAFKKQDRANISIRGKNAKKYVAEAIKDIPNSTGGGHEEACGAQVPIEDLDKFKNNLEKLAN